MSSTLIDDLTARADGSVTPYAWPGGYPIFYIMKDGGIVCPKCVNKEIKLIVDSTLAEDDPQWEIVASDINWEDDLYCEHCNERIPSAYNEEETGNGRNDS